MRFGLALDCGTERTTLDRLLAEYQPHIRLAERYGFDSVWIGQHYPTGPGRFHLPSPLLILAALAPLTSLELGTGVVLLPMWHPLTMAYDAAVLDQLSGGRLVLGVGIGRSFDWARFGVERARVGDRMDEMLMALKALWAGADRFDGKVVSIDGGIHPLPVRPGGPPLLVGGSIGRAMRRAAVLGDGWYAGTTHRIQDIRTIVARYRAALAEAGKAPTSGRVAANRVTVLAETPERAWADGGPRLGSVVSAYAALGSTMSASGEPAEAALRRIADECCLIGTPETVLPTIEAYADAGVTDVALRVAPGDLPAELVARTITLAGEQILPRFR